jgi:hypothetical protein
VYREERWYELLEEALLLALDCAKRLDDETNVYRISLELLSDGTSPQFALTVLEFSLSNNDGKNFNVPLFMSEITKPLTSEGSLRTEIIVDATEFVSFGQSQLAWTNSSVIPSFAFQSNSAFAGSPVSFQLSLRSQARKTVPPIVFSSARLSFNEQIPEIQISHVQAPSEAIQRFKANVTTGTADLSLRSGQVKVLEFSSTPIAQAQIEVHLPMNETDS